MTEVYKDKIKNKAEVEKFLKDRIQTYKATPEEMCDWLDYIIKLLIKKNIIK